MYIDDAKETLLVQRDSIKDGVDYEGNPEVIEVDARTGKYKTVQRSNVLVGSWLVDGKGVVRAGLGGDGSSGPYTCGGRSGRCETRAAITIQSDIQREHHRSRSG
jgi:hypothetical protein